MAALAHFMNTHFTSAAFTDITSHAASSVLMGCSVCGQHVH